MKKDPKILIGHILDSIEDIEWRHIAGMRDKLIHDYFGVNIKVVWKTVREDVPKLKKQITELYEGIQKNPKL